VVTRLDTGTEARARVAWQRQSKAGRFDIGIELLNCENFWSFEWGGGEGVPPEAGWNATTRN
jgi:hypothetical protein